ncbi:IclR family transcriptional regulator [Jatrophihabitans sp. DSM 45814]
MIESAGEPGVQSVHRALGLIETVADAGGNMSIRELADATELPQPTVHRLLRTLVERGYMRQLPDRSYALGFHLVPLGAAANAQVGAGVERVLTDLVRELGETANLAILTGDKAEYVAQAPSSHAMRMFTEVGRRVDLHATGVGKALLAQLDDEEVIAIVRRTGLAARTAHTIATELALHAALAEIRARGYAIDEQEQELGVRCVAVAIPSLRTALSVSGPLTRMDDELVARAVPLLLAASRRLATG